MGQFHFNVDTATSPLTSWTLNQTQVLNAKKGFGYALASRVVGLSVTVAMAGDLTLHAVLAVSKAIYALGTGTLQVGAGFVGYTKPIGFKSLSHWTKEEAAGHLGKVLAYTVLGVLNILASVAPGTIQIPMLVNGAVARQPKALQPGRIAQAQKAAKKAFRAVKKQAIAHAPSKTGWALIGAGVVGAGLAYYFRAQIGEGVSSGYNTTSGYASSAYASVSDAVSSAVKTVRCYTWTGKCTETDPTKKQDQTETDPKVEPEVDPKVGTGSSASA